MAERFLRLKEVRLRVPYSRSSIYAKIRIGEFPRPVSLGARAAFWRESDIDGWIEAQILEDKARGGAA